MKIITIILMFIVLASGCETGQPEKNGTRINTADAAKTQITSRLSNWCAGSTCLIAEDAIPVMGCGELGSDGKKYALYDDVVTDVSAQSDVFGCIIIKQGGITLDCQGHKIKYTGIRKYGVALPGNGIRIYESGTTIKNCWVEGFERGISANAWSSNKHLVNLHFENNVLFNSTQDGIHISGSDYSIIKNNVMFKNLRGIYVISSDIDVIFENNMACGNNVGDFTCIGSEPEGAGNTFGKTTLCDNQGPKFVNCTM